MTKSIKYRCPECDGEFTYLHHPNVEEDLLPRFCPLCGFDTKAEIMVSAPAIASGRSKVIDGTYRQMEEGSAYRAQLADDPSLKITNMQDNLRAGDIAAAPINNPVSQAMDRQPGRWGFQPNGQQQAEAAHTDYLPNAGLRALDGLRRQHGAAGGTTTHMPALETQQSGYRRRI